VSTDTGDRPLPERIAALYGSEPPETDDE